MWKYDSKAKAHTDYSTSTITDALYSVYIARSDLIDENKDYF